METLVQLKNNEYLMGLFRNCPPPDLQYDNSSGKLFVLLMSFPFFPLVPSHESNDVLYFIARTLSYLYLCSIPKLGGDRA